MVILNEMNLTCLVDILWFLGIDLESQILDIAGYLDCEIKRGCLLCLSLFEDLDDSCDNID
jgi:hypothetical protein